jgi:hypothetical protein
VQIYVWLRPRQGVGPVAGIVSVNACVC